MGIAYIIAIISLIVVFALGLLILANMQRSSAKQTFAALIFFIGFWLSSSLFVDLSTSLTGVIFWAQTSIVWAAAIPALWLYFAHVFPKKNKLNHIRQLIIILPALIFLVLSPTTLNIETLRISPIGEREIVHGPLYSFLLIYFLIFIVWAFARLYKSYRTNPKIIKIQIRYIFGGAVGAMLLALIGMVLFPFFGVEAVTNFSSLTVLVFIIASTYAILRHHLLQIRVMTAEIFTGLLLLTLLINVFSFKTKEQLILNLGLFLSAIIFGVFLVKSVLQEINAKEEIELMAHQLQNANLRLRRLDRAKSEFISIASHQLRTPLTAIKGYVSMILDGTYGNLDQEKREVLDRVYSSNERLIALVNDLLNLSRIERGKLQFEFRSVDDLAEILTSVVNESMVNATKKNLKIDYKEQKLPRVNADPHKLRQIFVNVIDNAIKYTEKGWIKIRTETTPKKIIFIFQDSGMGMTHEEINGIYEKFRRGRGGKKFHAGGMGIGLYICHKIIEAHEGKIYAKSKGLNQGTTFYVELPYNK